MVKKGKSAQKTTSHRDLVKTVSKQLKYYFEVRRQEDGFDLSGPECPRPDYPALKSRPMLLYEGLHDRSVKHFYSDQDVKQKITHMHTYNTSTAQAKKVETQMKKTMDGVSYVPPWMGVGTNGGDTRYTKNSEKYVTGTLGEWSMKPKRSRRRGYGNPEPTLTRAFAEPHGAKPRMRRSCPSGWIDNKECKRLVTGASRILASSEFREAVLTRPQSSKTVSTRSSEGTQTRARSASPQTSRSKHVTTYTAVKKSTPSRLTHRPQSGSNTLHERRTLTYHEAKDDVVSDHERKKTSQNLKKGKIYYDIDGRRKPVPHRVKNEDGYLEGEEKRDQSPETGDKKVPDWLRNQMRRQDVNEKKMPYNNSVRSVEISEPNTARAEDPSKRHGVRRVRPKSAKGSKSKSSCDDRHSHVTLSEGSYEEVKLDDSESEEDAYFEDRGCQTGWELFVQYDQTENILYDGESEATKYKITVRTGTSVGASTNVPIYLILYGSRGRSPDLSLIDCENHKILFQQNAGDVFYVTCSYVGQLNRIVIGHDSDTEAWYLDSVTVQDPTKGEVYEFLCDKWLSVKADDKMTRRQLEISASRKVDQDDDKEEEEEEDEAAAEDAIDSVAKSNSKPASRASSTSTRPSTSHLRNETGTSRSSKSKPQSTVTLPSQTASTTSIDTRKKKHIRLQEPFVSHRGGDYRGRRSPTNLEDFESDITLHSDRKTLSSRRSDSTVTDSEVHTARFEEQSVLTQDTVEDGKPHSDVDRLEGFKAGQRAERERQRLQEQDKQAETAHKTDVLRGLSIHQAAKSGNIGRIKELLDYSNELKDSVDVQGNMALHLATIQGHKDIVQLLAATGANLVYRDQAGYEPVHMAALHGHVNCLMILVAMGASINSETDDFKSPLHLAAMSGNMETCRWLVANRARLDKNDDFGRTPVDMAENNGHDDVARFLRGCISELKGRRTSLESLLIGQDEDGAWKDDKAEKPVVPHDMADSDTEHGESVADLRRDARIKEEKEAKRQAYEDMQQKLAEGNMTYLDRIRYEVDNS